MTPVQHHSHAAPCMLRGVNQRNPQSNPRTVLQTSASGLRNPPELRHCDAPHSLAALPSHFETDPSPGDPDPQPTPEASLERSDIWWQAYGAYLDSQVTALDAVQQRIKAAIDAQDYSAAAALKHERDTLQLADAMRTVTLAQRKAVQCEDFVAAAQLRDRAQLHLRGWWQVVADGSDPWGHVLYISESFGCLEARAFTPSQIADAQGWKEQTPFHSPNPSDPPLTQRGVPLFEILLHQSKLGELTTHAFILPRRLSRNLALAKSVFGVSSSGSSPQKGGPLGGAPGPPGPPLPVTRPPKGSSTVFHSSTAKARITARMARMRGLPRFTDAQAAALALLKQNARESVDAAAADAAADPASDGAVAAGADGPDTAEAGASGAAGAADAGGSESGDSPRGVCVEDGDAADDGCDASGGRSSSRPGAVKGRSFRRLDVRAMGQSGLLGQHGVNEGAGGPAADPLTGQLVPRMSGSQAGGSGAQNESELVHALQSLSDAAGGQASQPTSRVTAHLHSMTDDGFSLLMPRVHKGTGPRTIRYARLDESLCGPAAAADPLTGYFLGSFGVHGPELLLLQRAICDGEEAVVAYKVTGDPHVPAGQVSFRAKIGKAHRQRTDMYPAEMDVSARFSGDGCVAEPNFQNHRWCKGDLLMFGPNRSERFRKVTGSADLGFIWTMTYAKRFLILLSRVQFDRA